MKKSTRLLRTAASAALACLLLASPAPAEEEEAENDVFQLGTMVVRIDVQGEKLDVTEQMEKSVTRSDIELFEKKDVATAIGRMPGVRYVGPTGRRSNNSTSNNRNESGVVIRGYQAFGSQDSAVMVYLDGIPAYIPYSYIMDMGRFTTSGVSTINVSKGYSSVLFGPNAIGGAVNIVSQRPTTPLYGNFVIGTGTGNVAEISGIFGTLQDKWYAQAGWSYIDKEFVRAAEAYKGTDSSGRTQDTDRRNYGTNDKKMEFKFGFIPNETDEYVVSYLKQVGVRGPRRDVSTCSEANPDCWAQGYMNTWWEWPHWDRETISFVSSTNFGKVYIKPRVFFDKYDNGMSGWGTINDVPINNIANRDGSVSMYDDYAWGGSFEIGANPVKNNTLKGKFDYKFNQHEGYNISAVGGTRNDDSYRKLEEQIFFFAVEDSHVFNRQWETQVGLLYSRRQTTFVGEGLNIGGLNSMYPAADFDMKPSDIDSWDPQAALIYNLNNNHSFHYSISKKTRYPSMRGQYSNYGSTDILTGNPNCPLNPDTNKTECLRVMLPNPDLKPERALHHEIGWKGAFFSNLKIDLAWFYSENNNMIARSTPEDVTTYPGFAVQQTINVAGDVRRQGVDLGVEYAAMDRILIGTSFGYLHSANKDNPDWRPSEQPAYSGSLYANIGLNKWAALIPALDYQGRSRASSTGDQRWSYHQGYALFETKLSITPPMYRNISINVGVENIFNKDYRGWSNRPADNYFEQYPTPGRYVYANVRYRL